ncbi:MAG: rhodanese-like domain-containing protein, partial [Gemmatimonadota bacterium]
VDNLRDLPHPPRMPPAKPPRKRFTKRTILALLVLLAVLAGLLWDGSPLGSFALRQALRLKFQGVRQVAPAELVAWMADPNRPPPMLIDARPPEQFAVSRIDGSVEIDPTAPDLHPLNHISKDQPLVVYDAAGAQGTAMVIALTNEGFTRVSNLEGGIFRWANEGHPLVSDAGPATKVYPLTWAWGRLLKSRYHP